MLQINKQAGFSLIELLIAVAIVGVLASIAVPSYREYTMRANRTDGAAMINHIMQAEERFFAENRTYTIDLTELGFATANNVDSADNRYKISAQACGADALTLCVQLVATAQGAQAKDKNGNSGNLSLNSRGEALGYDNH